MKPRTFGRHVRESFKSLGRNGWMTFASASAVTVTLFLVGVFTIIMMNLGVLADNIEENVEIKLTVDPAANEEAIEQLSEEIKAIKEIGTIEHATKEEELEHLVSTYGDEFNLFKMSNPLGDAFYIRTADPLDTPKVSKKLEKLNYVSDVVYGEGTVEKLFNVVQISRNIGLILIVGLLFTAMFLISNTIKLTINARGTEIEIMKLVGATNSFVRIPFVLEGIWLGILGAIIPMTVLSIAYNRLYAWLSPQLKNEILQLLSPSPFLFQLNGLLLLLGVLIGVWGSFMSVRKFLKV